MELTDVHIKSHVRRGLRHLANKGVIKIVPAASTFYAKGSAEGMSSFENRLKSIRKDLKLDKPTKEDAALNCVDLPLFGYVHAVKKESFNLTNSANVLFPPATFHACDTPSVGKNNAFVGVKEDGEEKGAAGSNSVDVLTYGTFLALWEINIPTLKENIKGHKLGEDVNQWVGWLTEALWAAYGEARYPSVTQRSQFARFLVVWQYESYDAINPINPKDLIALLPEDKRKVTTQEESKEGLTLILPTLFTAYQAKKFLFEKYVPGYETLVQKALTK